MPNPLPGMLVIGPNWVRRDDKASRETSFQAARALEFAFARGGIQWLDGLMLFPEWQEGGQDQPYETLMGVQISKANGALTEVGFNEPHLERHGEQIWKWYRTNPQTKRPESNVSASVELAKSATALFQEGRVERACARLTEAYGWWFDAHGIAEAVCAAPDTAEAMQKLARLPPSIVDDLQTYATRLLFAIGAVYGATRTDPEQFQPEIVNPVLAGWIGVLGRVAEAIRRLRSRVVEAPAPTKDDLQQFVVLAKRYIATLPEPDKRAYWKRVWRRPPPSRRRRASRDRTDKAAPAAEDHAEAVERNQLLEDLMGCALVSEIRLALRAEREDYARGRLDTREDRNAVRTALHEFLSSREPIEPTYLVAKLRRKIRLAIASERAGEVLEVHERRPWAARREIEKALEAVLADSITADTAIGLADSAIRKDLGSNLRTLIRQALRQRQPRVPLARGLRPLKEELKPRSNEAAQWSRKTDPTAADFRDGHMYRPDDLIDEVRDKFSDSRVVLITGERATGKSVLARWLAYDWSDGGFEDAYYLDCRLDGDFDVREIQSFIKQSDALFILENMHLESTKLQRLWRELRDADLDGFVLITARPIPYTDSRLEPLDTLPTVLLPPFAHADDIISAIAAQAEHPGVFALQATRDQLRTVAKDDYWLLTYALRGCDAAAGHGEPKAWIGEGVREDLRNLELDSPYLPRVLLSLAPMYIHETLTAEAFLINQLGFSETELQEPLRRREIVRSERFGQFFYGLPHASLAEAYWEHGQEFRRKLWSLEDFIYRYAAAETPNGLEAVASAPSGVFRRVDERLEKDGLTNLVLGRERSSRGIRWWLRRRARESRLPSPILASIADRLHASDELADVTVCLGDVYAEDRRAGDSLLSVVAGPALTWRLNQRATADDLRWLLRSVHSGSRACKQKLLSGLDATRVGERLNAEVTSNPRGVCSCIAAIYAADRHTGDQVCAEVNMTSLGKALNADAYVDGVCTALMELRRAHEPGAVSVARALDFCQLIASAQELTRAPDVVSCVGALANCASLIGQSIATSLNVQKLAMLIAGLDHGERMVQCAVELFKADASIGTAVWEPLRSDCARRINRAGDVKQLCRCIAALHGVSLSAAVSLWSARQQDEVKKHIDQCRNTEETIECVCTLYDVHQACGGNPSDLADPARIAAALDTDNDTTRVCRCLGSLFGSAESIGERVWSWMNHERFAQRLNAFSDLGVFQARVRAMAKGGERLREATEPLWDGDKLTQRVVDADDLADAMHTLCETLTACYEFTPRISPRIGWSRLGERLNHTDDTALVAAALRWAGQVSDDAGRTMWSVIDRRALAARVARLDTGYDIALALGDFCGADPNMAQELWTHIKQSGRLTELVKMMTPADADTLVNHVRLWNEGEAVELASMVHAVAEGGNSKSPEALDDDRFGSRLDPLDSLPDPSAEHSSN